MSPAQSGGALAGRRIALPEARELDKLAELLESEGASTLRCPLVAIRDAPDPEPVAAWLRLLAAGAMDVLVFLTGEGLRRLLAAADRLDLLEPVVGAIGRARKITRGPKPARALHEIGLSPDFAASVPTTAGVIEVLRKLDLRGHRVGVQLYGQEPNRPLVASLEEAGAIVYTVAPYVYASASDESEVRNLITTIAAGRVDAIAFTSGAQVDRLWQVAAGAGAEAALMKGLARVRVAAIGPIVVDALKTRGVSVHIVPEKAFVMRRLVNALAESLGPVR